jgi:hypothetical protein
LTAYFAVSPQAQPAAMDSWEDDDYEVPSLAPVAIKSAWDDEEEEEEKVEKAPTQPSEKQVRSPECVQCIH